MKTIALLIVSAFALACPSVAAADWTHKDSGVSVPDTIGEMRRGEERDLSNGEKLDVMIQYGSDTEPVTLYVYRSSYPNPALWFERTQSAMGDNVGRFDDRAAPRQISIGGSAPNGLRAEYALPGTPWKATGIVLVQSGEWLVKLRATSQTLDPAGIRERLDRLIAAMRFAKPVVDPVPLTVPDRCPAAVAYNGQPKRDDQSVARSAAMGIVAFGQARGMVTGLARKPAEWCRVDPVDAAQRKMATLYRSNDGTGWTALLGDARISLAAFDLKGTEPDVKAAATYLTRNGPTQVIATYDALPDLLPALAAAVPVLRGAAQPIATIGLSKKN